MTPERIFVLEPNLIKPSGHPIECSTSILRFCQSEKREVQIVGNVKLDHKAQQTTGAIAGLSFSCFQELASGGEYFYRDLQQLSKELVFCDSDLVIVMTSYVNEIRGAAKFMAISNDRAVPFFSFYFHQLFPPTEQFSESTEFPFQNHWQSELSDAFGSLPAMGRFHLWTTPSEALRQAYSQAAGQRVRILPYPSLSPAISTKTHHLDRQRGRLVFGFLGDGRYEKGLLQTLLAIAERRDFQNSYVIQTIDVRGYSSDEYSLLNELMEKLSNFKNVTFIDYPLNVEEFECLVQSLDVMLLPYHPGSYDRRISSVFIHSIKNGTPAVVSSETWLGDEVGRNGVGVTFEYDPTDRDRTTRALVDAMLEIEYALETFRKTAEQQSSFYTNEYSAKSFMHTLLELFK
jgi:glycosyltransferase involved in cell wall biosynthesis